VFPDKAGHPPEAGLVCLPPVEESLCLSVLWLKSKAVACKWLFTSLPSFVYGQAVL
jgi:hypothetical protein